MAQPGAIIAKYEIFFCLHDLLKRKTSQIKTSFSHLFQNLSANNNDEGYNLNNNQKIFGNTAPVIGWLCREYS